MERLDYPDKCWLSLMDKHENLRIWQNGKILSVPEDYYDEFIINKAKKLHSIRRKKEFIIAPRIIGEVLGYLEQYVGDSFIEYRIRKLIEAGVFEAKGSLEAMRLYRVRLKLGEKTVKGQVGEYGQNT
ncbi:DUF3658 domain-containing protein [Heyndrickxia acidiproducens]|uniref:DUF3658 domain-containing protein n=1 Tax=Heyndrickxia acidiproducens TaxID=1121084 RepID=UPI0003786302|nr:DUF3658 domain-containing protein [Heyndrickxia acidiproducens]